MIKTALLSFDIEEWFQVENMKGAIRREDWDTMASSVEKRIARALLVFRIDRFGRVTSIASARVESFMPRLTSIKSKFTRMDMATSNRQRLIVL